MNPISIRANLMLHTKSYTKIYWAEQKRNMFFFFNKTGIVSSSSASGMIIQRHIRRHAHTHGVRAVERKGQKFIQWNNGPDDEHTSVLCAASNDCTRQLFRDVHCEQEHQQPAANSRLNIDALMLLNTERASVFSQANVWHGDATLCSWGLFSAAASHFHTSHFGVLCSTMRTKLISIIIFSVCSISMSSMRTGVACRVTVRTYIEAFVEFGLWYVSMRQRVEFRDAGTLTLLFLHQRHQRYYCCSPAIHQRFVAISHNE